MPAYEKWGWDRTEGGVRANLTTAVSASGIRIPVRQEVASLVIGIVNEIEATLGRPINPSGGNWGFCYRNIRGGNSLSAHAYGLAFDLESSTNPMTTNLNAAHTLPDSTGQIVAKYGFEWGGNWTKRADFMHIQWKAGPASEAANHVADLGGQTHPVSPPPVPADGNVLAQLAAAFEFCKKGAVKNGDRNDCVKLLQAVLANKFGYQIVADGIFGPATDRAVRAFQASKGLGVDGVAGRQTFTALTT